jgi:hypothetical protein
MRINGKVYKYNKIIQYMPTKLKPLKKVRKWGSSLAILLDKEICDLYNIKEGDIIDISEFMVVKDGDKNGNPEV